MDHNPLAKAWLRRAQPHLQTITGAYAAKRRATLMMVLFSQEFGIPQEWGRADVLARSTWSKHKDRPEIKSVMEAIRQELAAAQEEMAISSVAEAVLKMQVAAPRMAERLILLAEQGENHWVQLQASQSVLDRADKSTAPKQQKEGLEIPQLDTLLEKIYGPDNE